MTRLAMAMTAMMEMGMSGTQHSSTTAAGVHRGARHPKSVTLARRA